MSRDVGLGDNLSEDAIFSCRARVVDFMGFRFRKSFKVIPGVRLNLSGGGASVSLGTRGFWYTIGSRGSRTTVGIPGSGLSWTSYQKHNQHLPPQRSVLDRESSGDNLVPIESADIDIVAANSTHELGPILEKRFKRLQIGLPVFYASICLCLLLHLLNVKEMVLLVGAVGLTCAGLLRILDRYRTSLSIEYKLGGEALANFNALTAAFEEIERGKSWQTEAQGLTNDWKRNAGANILSQRRSITSGFGKPSPIKTKIKFPYFKLHGEEIYFAPDAVLVVAKSGIAVLRYHDLIWEFSVTKFVESENLARDAIVLGQTWAYVNKEGGPDRRFRNNRQIPVCLYGELSFKTAGGLDRLLQFSNPCSGSRFSTELQITRDFVENDQLFQRCVREGSAGITLKAPSDWPNILSWTILAALVAFLTTTVSFATNGFQLLQNSAKPTSPIVLQNRQLDNLTRSMASDPPVPLPKSRPPLNLLPPAYSSK
jgi:hypothetical protein